MLEFRIRNIVPPGGCYFYEAPETGVRIEGLTWTGLRTTINKHYGDNGLQVPPDIEARIMDFMCRRLPAGFCTGSDDGRPRARVTTLQQIRQATQTLAAGNPRVAPGEARRRAETCGKCPGNDRSMCPTCVGLVSWARRLSGAQTGAIDEILGVCTVDGTALAATIHFRNFPEDEAYPDNCWRKLK